MAADVNLDGVISTADMDAIEAYILGFESSFNNSLSVDWATFNNVWAVFPTQPSVNAMSGPGLNVSYATMYNYPTFPFTSLIGQQFYGIQLGDVGQDCPSFF